MRPLCFPYLQQQRQQRAAAIEFGGGVANFGTLTVRGSIVLSNTASDDGGVIYNAAQVYGPVTIMNGTVSGNSAGVQGGGISNASVLSVNGSGVIGNTAPAGPTSTTSARSLSAVTALSA